MSTVAAAAARAAVTRSTAFSVERISVAEADWDDFVLRHPLAGPGHLAAAVAFEHALSGADSHAVGVFDASHRLVGLTPLFLVERRVRPAIVRTLTSGTSLRSGPLLSTRLSAREAGRALTALIDGTTRLARELKCDSVSISYPVVVGQRPAVEHFGFLPLKPYGFAESSVVALLLDLHVPADALFAGFDPACRNRVRRCEKAGATFRTVRDRTEWLDCHELNVQTLEGGALSRRAMEVLWDGFVEPGHATVSVVEYDGSVVSTIVVVGLNGACYYWFGFNRRPVPLPGASDFALWNAMRLWQEKGVRYFELGSLEFGGGKHGNIAAFKQRFGGQARYAIGGDLLLRPQRRLLLDLVRLGGSKVREMLHTVRGSGPDHA